MYLPNKSVHLSAYRKINKSSRQNWAWLQTSLTELVTAAAQSSEYINKSSRQYKMLAQISERRGAVFFVFFTCWRRCSERKGWNKANFITSESFKHGHFHSRLDSLVGWGFKFFTFWTIFHLFLWFRRMLFWYQSPEMFSRMWNLDFPSSWRCVDNY